MKALCTCNNIKDISDATARDNAQKYIRKSNGEVDLTIGKTYTIYGKILREGRTWLYICQETHDEYPLAYPIDCFKLIDPNPSKYWQENNSGDLLIKKWAEDQSFLERLVDGEIFEVTHFKEQRKLMDSE